MNVGDLVRCTTVEGKPAGLVVERYGSPHIFTVLLRHDGLAKMITASFQKKQLELVNASRGLGDAQA